MKTPGQAQASFLGGAGAAASGAAAARALALLKPAAADVAAIAPEVRALV
jgi:hypothetical protein